MCHLTGKLLDTSGTLHVYMELWIVLSSATLVIGVAATPIKVVTTPIQYSHSADLFAWDITFRKHTWSVQLLLASGYWPCWMAALLLLGVEVKKSTINPRYDKCGTELLPRLCTNMVPVRKLYRPFSGSPLYQYAENTLRQIDCS